MTSTNNNLTASLASLTELENKALIAAFDSSASNGHDFGYSSDISVEGLAKKANGALVTNLIKKGIITNPDSEFDQFALVGWDESEKTAAAVTIYNHLTSLGFVVRKPFWIK